MRQSTAANGREAEVDPAFKRWLKIYQMLQKVSPLAHVQVLFIGCSYNSVWVTWGSTEVTCLPLSSAARGRSKKKMVFELISSLMIREGIPHFQHTSASEVVIVHICLGGICVTDMLRQQSVQIVVDQQSADLNRLQSVKVAGWCISYQLLVLLQSSSSHLWNCAACTCLLQFCCSLGTRWIY